MTFDARWLVDFSQFAEKCPIIVNFNENALWT
jgi:hypothetical protein